MEIFRVLISFNFDQITIKVQEHCIVLYTAWSMKDYSDYPQLTTMNRKYYSNIHFL